MPNKTEIVGICLYPRFSNHCLANALEPLRAANDLSGRALYRWHLLTPEGGSVLSSSGLPVAAEGRLGAAPGGDLLMLMPGYGHEAFTRHGADLRRAAFRYGTVAGLDAGAWLMAQAGLLTGRRATIHAELQRPFEARFPDLTVLPARWIEDGPRLTAGGATAAFELVLHLIRRRHGGALAQDIAALFLAGPESGPSDRLVARALAVMEAHVEAPLPVAEIARRTGASPRGLARRFARSLGETPRAVYGRLRLEAGRRAMEAGEGVTEAAARAGYADASAFARAMRRCFGAAPSTFR
ncbi:GlxA family transcriptional regulator [Jannaschia seohaensis]|nr:helix-turn-helix domain-containing protein [Jannaschia seohaensis]